jgi:hypothetical protein
MWTPEAILLVVIFLGIAGFGLRRRWLKLRWQLDQRQRPAVAQPVQVAAPARPVGRGRVRSRVQSQRLRRRDTPIGTLAVVKGWALMQYTRAWLQFGPDVPDYLILARLTLTGGLTDRVAIEHGLHIPYGTAAYTLAARQLRAARRAVARGERERQALIQAASAPGVPSQRMAA